MYDVNIVKQLLFSVLNLYINFRKKHQMIILKNQTQLGKMMMMKMLGKLRCTSIYQIL